MKLKMIGSKITKVNAARNPDFSGKISLNTNINVASVEKHNIEESNVETLKVSASFKVDYGDLGLVDIHGQLFLTGDASDLQTIQSKFDNKDFESDEMIAIMNLVMQKYSAKALSLEDEFGLPIHIKLPTLGDPKKQAA